VNVGVSRLVVARHLYSELPHFGCLPRYGKYAGSRPVLRES
jgi:hypothetical protein